MSIECCKSYVGKQVIGLLPSDIVSTECLYVGYIDLNGGGSLSDYTLTDNITPITDAYGDGYLRTLMQSQSGNVYGVFYDPANFISQGLHIYYVGTSANNIDVNFFGSYFSTINFTPLTNYSIDCRPINCYTVTFGVEYLYLTNMYFSAVPLTEISSDITSSAPFYNQITITNTTQMGVLVNQIFGSSASYSLIDNGNDTYTMTISDAYYFGIVPVISLSSGRDVATFNMVDC